LGAIGLAAFGLACYLVAKLANSMFNANVQFEQLVRALGLAYIWRIIGVIGIIGVIPFLNCFVKSHYSSGGVCLSGSRLDCHQREHHHGVNRDDSGSSRGISRNTGSTWHYRLNPGTGPSDLALSVKG